jgi:hypothetical protein
MEGCAPPKDKSPVMSTLDVTDAFDFPGPISQITPKWADETLRKWVQKG